MTGGPPVQSSPSGEAIAHRSREGVDADSTEPEERAIRAQLDQIVDPCSAARGTELGLVEMGLVDSVDISDRQVHIALRLTGPGCMQVPYFVEQITERVGTCDGVTDVTVSTDAGLEWTPEMMSESARRQRRERRRSLERQAQTAETGTLEPDSPPS